MESILTSRQFRQSIREICVPLDFSHTITVTAWDQYRNLPALASVSRRLNHNLNKAIWGGNSYDKGKAALSWVSVIQGDRSCRNMHLHCAVGNFKSGYDERELQRRFGKAVMLTPGIALEREFAPIQSKEAWIDYITREVTVWKDEQVLIEQFCKGITPKAHSGRAAS